jgi:hypothetical protein
MKSVIYVPKRSSVLVIDDSHERLDWFNKKLTNVHAVYADSPIKAERAAGFYPYDMVFLDHDAVPELIDKTDPNYYDKTFYRVAEALARLRYPGIVIIHSHNPIGARRMAALLERYAHVQIMPFGSFDIEVS